MGSREPHPPVARQTGAPDKTPKAARHPRATYTPTPEEIAQIKYDDAQDFNAHLANHINPVIIFNGHEGGDRNKAAAIIKLQSYIKSLANDESIPPEDRDIYNDVNINGVFDKETQKALEAYNKRNWDRIFEHATQQERVYLNDHYDALTNNQNAGVPIIFTSATARDMIMNSTFDPYDHLPHGTAPQPKPSTNDQSKGTEKSGEVDINEDIKGPQNLKELRDSYNSLSDREDPESMLKANLLDYDRELKAHGQKGLFSNDVDKARQQLAFLAVNENKTLHAANERTSAALRILQNPKGQNGQYTGDQERLITLFNRHNVEEMSDRTDTSYKRSFNYALAFDKAISRYDSHKGEFTAPKPGQEDDFDKEAGKDGGSPKAFRERIDRHLGFGDDAIVDPRTFDASVADFSKSEMKRVHDQHDKGLEVAKQLTEKFGRDVTYNDTDPKNPVFEFSADPAADMKDPAKAAAVASKAKDEAKNLQEFFDKSEPPIKAHVTSNGANVRIDADTLITTEPEKNDKGEVIKDKAGRIANYNVTINNDAITAIGDNSAAVHSALNPSKDDANKTDLNKAKKSPEHEASEGKKFADLRRYLNEGVDEGNQIHHATGDSTSWKIDVPDGANRQDEINKKLAAIGLKSTFDAKTNTLTVDYKDIPSAEEMTRRKHQHDVDDAIEKGRAKLEEDINKERQPDNKVHVNIVTQNGTQYYEFDDPNAGKDVVALNAAVGKSSPVHFESTTNAVIPGDATQEKHKGVAVRVDSLVDIGATPKVKDDRFNAIEGNQKLKEQLKSFKPTTVLASQRPVDIPDVKTMGLTPKTTDTIVFNPNAPQLG